MAAEKKNVEKKNIRTYALIAVGVSLLACLAAVVVAISIGLNAMGWFLPKNIDTWKQAFWTSLAIFFLGISIYGILLPDDVRRFLSGRQARYGSNSLILLLAMIAVLVMVNVLAINNEYTVVDATSDKSHTLKPETLQVLGGLTDKIFATGYFTSGSSTAQADDLLSNFKSNSDGKFDYTFKDPDANPVEVRNAGIVGDGKILLTMGDRKEVASYADETELVRAIIRLTNPGTRVVYFLTGHGEADIAGSGDIALTNAKSTLEGKNYTVKPLNLLADNKIPDDALAVIVAGPTKPVSDKEVALLKQFVENGGGLVVAEDPQPLTDFGTDTDPLAEYLKSSWGIQLDNDIVIDLTNQGNELMAVTSGLSREHPVTRGMSKVAIMPNARSISLETAPQDVTLTSLAQTTDQSWGETNFDNLEGTRVQYDEGSDVLGPLTLGAAGENSANKGRVVVFGSTTFATDGVFSSYGNGDIFINAVDWTAQQDDLITLTPYSTTERTLKDPTQIPSLLILFFAVFALPGAIVVMGGVNWFLRRRRG